MAAGLGFKDFQTGEVLTAADVDGYLMQNIWVFASAAARDAAVTSPSEGNFAFTKDTNSLWYYDGAAWVASGATGDIEGVTAGIGISGGGTSGTVTVTNSMATAIDAKGDLVAGTGADTFAKLTVGANDTILTADSTAATGLKWATPASSGGMTLIQEQTASANSAIDFTSISGSYKQLLLTWQGIYESNSTTTMSVRFNADSGNNYHYMAGAFRGGSQAVESGGVSDITDGNNGLAPFGYGCDKTVLSERAAGYLLIDNYSSATKLKEYYGMFRFRYSTTSYFDSFVGTYDSTTAITQVNIVRIGGAGTMSNATNTSIRLYGIS